MKRNEALEKAMGKLECLFEKQNTNQIWIEKKYLSEIFDADLLEISKNDGLPILKLFVIDHLRVRGITIKFDINEAQFIMHFVDPLELDSALLKDVERRLKLKVEQMKTLEDLIEKEDDKANLLEERKKELEDILVKLKKKQINILKKSLKLNERHIKILERSPKKNENKLKLLLLKKELNEKKNILDRLDKI